MLVFVHTGGLSGAEAGIAGGSAVVAQRLLEAIFGDQAVRDMARKARGLLLERVATLYTAERERYTTVTGELSVSEAQIRRLEQATAAVGEVSR